MRVTFHDGALKRWQVPVESVRPRGLVAQGDDGDHVIVFATDARGAKLTAVEKMADKYYRHQGIHTVWKVTGKPVEC